MVKCKFDKYNECVCNEEMVKKCTYINAKAWLYLGADKKIHCEKIEAEFEKMVNERLGNLNYKL